MLYHSRPVHCLLTGIFVCIPAIAWSAQDYKVTFSAQTFQANNAVSINQFDGDFLGFKADSPRLHALVDNSAYLRAEKRGFAFQVYKKQEVFLSASSATAQLYSDINSSLLRTVTRSYPLEFSGYGIEQTGIGLEKSIEFKSSSTAPSSRLAAQVRVYNIDRYREVQVDGFAEARAPISYAASVVALDRNTQLDGVDSIGGPSKGRGYALDLSGRWVTGPRLALFMDLQDLSNTNRIESLPHKRQTLQGSVGTRSLLSLLRPLPEIQQQTGSESYGFRLPVKTTLGFEYTVGKLFLHKVGFQAKKIRDLTLTRASLTVGNPFPYLEAFEIGYESHFRTVDVSTRFKYGGIRLGADSLDDEKRRVEYLQVFFFKDL